MILLAFLCVAFPERTQGTIQGPILRLSLLVWYDTNCMEGISLPPLIKPLSYFLLHSEYRQLTRRGIRLPKILMNNGTNHTRSWCVCQYIAGTFCYVQAVKGLSDGGLSLTIHCWNTKNFNHDATWVVFLPLNMSKCFWEGGLHSKLNASAKQLNLLRDNWHKFNVKQYSTLWSSKGPQNII